MLEIEIKKMLLLSSLQRSKKTIELLCKDFSALSESEVYKVLYELSKDELIIAFERKNKRRKKYVEYEITEKGSAELESKRAWWNELTDKVNKKL